MRLSNGASWRERMLYDGGGRRGNARLERHLFDVTASLRRTGPIEIIVLSAQSLSTVPYLVVIPRLFVGSILANIGMLSLAASSRKEALLALSPTANTRRIMGIVYAAEVTADLPATTGNALNSQSLSVAIRFNRDSHLKVHI